MSTTATSTEPRGIAAAMAQPAFSPRMGQSALGAADRATRRWAPESPEDQPRSMRSLSFVDRMVSPWVTAAQRSAGLRMFSQYASSETPERVISGVSWVFPRPWYQDELDWIAASRASQAGQDMIFTTRGTYAQAADRRRETSLPSLEYVAPSFSPATSDSTPAYSPLVSHSSYSAASVVAQSMQAIAAAGAMARGLPVRQAFAEQPSSSSSSSSSSYRSLAGISSIAPLVSSLIPDGESGRFSIQPSALAMRAPTMVTPPSPRGDDPEATAAATEAAELRSEHAIQAARSEREAAVARAAAETTARQEQSRAMAVTFAQERERVAEQMRATARAERERAAAAQLEPAVAAPTPVSAAALQAAAAEAARTEAIREEVARVERARETTSRLRSSARQQARIDAIVAERLARLEPIAGAEPAAVSSSVSPVETAAPVAAAPTEAQSQAMVQALRMAELLAHAAAIGPSAMAPSAGPRMALPSGLGGLVAGMNTVSVIERERAAAVEQAPRRQGALPFTFGFQPIYTAAAAESSTAAPSQLAPSSSVAAFGPADDVAAAPAPVFATPSWTRAPRALVPEAMRVDSALGSIASRTPAALGHVAWADRWLGRFAGASETALESMSSISMRAQYAPSQLFVAPSLDVPRQVSESGHFAPAMAAPNLEVVAPRRQEVSARVEAPSIAAAAAAQAQAPRVEAPRPVAAPQEALRFGDDDVVPDELFAAIAAGPVSRPPQRAAATSASKPTAAAAAASAAAQTATARSAAPQLTAADIVALTAPSAPVDAGLSASLAASPMAPALGHVLSLPRAAVFDPRSLGGSELAFAFLSGAVTAPMVAQFSYGSSAAGSMGAAGSMSSWEPSLAATGEGPSLWRQWSAELVRPAELSRAAAMRGDDAEVIASTPRPAPAFTAPSAQPVASGAVAAPGSSVSAPAAAAAEAAAAAASVENIITLRSTLLSPASPRQQRLAASSGTVASWVNQEAVDALPVAYQTLGELLSEAAPDRRWLSTLPAGLSAEGTPLAGDETEHSVRFDHGFPLVFWPLASAPGSVGAAMAASVAQEAEAARTTRSTTAAAARAPWAPSWAAVPEAEVLAPSAATLVEQGMPGSMDRGALSPGMLAQRALGFGATQSSQTADLSFDFVPPELVLAARVYGFGATEAAQAARLAMGGSTGLSAMAGAVDLRFISLMGPAMGAAGAAGAGRADATSSTGEPRSSEAPAREADASFGVAKRMPRGAFLLPSASVAAMGLSAALPEGEHAMSIAALEVLAAKMVAELGSFASPSMQAMAAGAAGAESASPSRRAPSSTFVDISQPAAAPEASEEDVLSSASASIAASRRTRFEQLYIALAESNTGRTMSPAARAARALALANRDEDATTFSSRERAALAWQIFPVVLNGEAAPVSASDDGRESADGRGASSSRSRSAPALTTVAPAADRPGAEMRPGLASLSSRAGEALSSFVTSSPASSGGGAASSAASGGENRGWKSGRFGGGEVEIPSWFEAAARKMFEERGEIEGISLAELTLVAATPPAQIAASTRGETPASVTQRSEAPGAKGEQGQKVDIEKVAGEVYRAVMQMMESARMRNGEPYL